MEAYLAQQFLSKEIELATQVQILDEAVCFSLYTNALRKDMNMYILCSPVIGK